MIYTVYINGQKEKEYKYKLQAIIYLMLRGFIYYGKGRYFIDEKAKIKESKVNV